MNKEIVKKITNYLTNNNLEFVYVIDKNQMNIVIYLNI